MIPPTPRPFILLALALISMAQGCQALQPQTITRGPDPHFVNNEHSHPNEIALTSGATSIASTEMSQSAQYIESPAQYNSFGPARELNKVVLPAYRIEPPDILIVEAVQVIPRQPYQLRVGDQLSIQVPGAFAEAPIAGSYPVGLGGMVNLGAPYGSVKVANLTIEQAQSRVIERLKEYLNEDSLHLIAVDIIEIVGKQQIQGQHLVAIDGMVTLGTYGSVSVVGHTIAEAKLAIEAHLSQFLEAPEVAVDVYAFNSKAYYVVTQGGGLGDQVVRVPFTGNETVLDAISQINGLTQVSSKQIWVARPGRNQCGNVQILPVDWNAVTKWADVETNYQILPGDRIFIAEDRRVAFDTDMGKTLAPFERAIGFSLLGVQAVSRFSGNVLTGGGLRGFNSTN